MTYIPCAGKPETAPSLFAPAHCGPQQHLATMQTDSPNKLEKIIQSLELMIDSQDNQSHDNADQFAKIQKRFDRLEAEIKRFSELQANPNAEPAGELDWKAQKEKILAQYGVAPQEKSVQAAESDDPTPDDVQTPEPVDEGTALRLSSEQEQEVNLLKDELREKIRQVEVELSIKQAKLEQQEVRMEEKKAELERLSNNLKTQEPQTPVESSTGVLGRLKKHLSFLSFNKQKMPIEDLQEDRRLESLKEDISRKRIKESATQPASDENSRLESQTTPSRLTETPAAQLNSSAELKTKESTAKTTEELTAKTTATEESRQEQPAGNSVSQDDLNQPSPQDLESQLHSVLETSKLCDFLRDEPVDEETPASETKPSSKSKPGAESTDERESSEALNQEQLRITHVRSEEPQAELTKDEVASSESIIAELTALKAETEQKKAAETKAKVEEDSEFPSNDLLDDEHPEVFGDSTSDKPNTKEAKSATEQKLVAVATGNLEPEASENENAIPSSSPKGNAARSKRQARKKRNKRRKKRRL